MSTSVTFKYRSSSCLTKPKQGPNDLFYGGNNETVGPISEEIKPFPYSYNGKGNFGSEILESRSVTKIIQEAHGPSHSTEIGAVYVVNT